MIINGKRALAHIQLIHDIRPIPGADNIELVHVLGWTLIAKKGEFQDGDKAVYIEIDSQVPKDDERFAFLYSKNYKVKTYKLNKFGVISQGLALPISMFPELKNLDINTDVTDILNIIYAVEEDNHRKANYDIVDNLKSTKPKLLKKPFVKWLLKRKWGRNLLKFLFLRKKVNQKAFPSEYCSKTDEERIQNMPYILEDKEPYTITEKIDGTSSTYVLVNHAKPGKKPKYELIVSSRNVKQVTPNQKCMYEENFYWEMAFKYDLKNIMIKMLNLLPKSKYIVLQGETYGEKIQGNKYKLKGREIKFFNLIDDYNKKWESQEAKDFVEKFGLSWVPIVNTNYILPRYC